MSFEIIKHIYQGREVESVQEPTRRQLQNISHFCNRTGYHEYRGQRFSLTDIRLALLRVFVNDEVVFDKIESEMELDEIIADRKDNSKRKFGR